MSADLFAAFGDVPSQEQKSQAASHSNVQPVPQLTFFDINNTAPAPAQQPQQGQLSFQSSQPASKSQPEDNDDDDWGDFEGGSSTAPAPVPVKQDPFAFTSTAQVPQPHQPYQPSWQSAPVYKAKKSYDSNVLFDAEEDAGDDDDFGDFEGETAGATPAPPPPAPSSGLGDLLGDLSMSESHPPATNQGPTTTASRKTSAPPPVRKSPIGGFGTVAKAKSPPATTLPSEKKPEDSWDSFDDWEASIPTKPKEKLQTKPKQPPTAQASISQPTVSSPSYDEVQPGELPPTNVPPPGVLLSLFPTIFADAQKKLFQPMAAQTLPMRNKLLSEPGTLTFLQGYVALASVAARIIAGRKLRWKRDAHLSQGMRIGPASSRATSGMKLTGIDKSENMKEEREVSDLVRAWKEQVGRLRHVVSAANQAKAGSLSAVPEINEVLPVKTLKQSEGGVPAPQPCMLCGLKRDERISTAEQAVEDSFGEWWVDQVSMHRGCRNFWHEHKDKLRQR